MRCRTRPCALDAGHGAPDFRAGGRAADALSARPGVRDRNSCWREYRPPLSASQLRVRRGWGDGCGPMASSRRRGSEGPGPKARAPGRRPEGAAKSAGPSGGGALWRLSSMPTRWPRSMTTLRPDSAGSASSNVSSRRAFGLSGASQRPRRRKQPEVGSATSTMRGDRTVGVTSKRIPRRTSRHGNSGSAGRATRGSPWIGGQNGSATDAGERSISTATHRRRAMRFVASTNGPIASMS